MSHFVVLVRFPADREPDEVLAEMLAPFDEGTQDPRFRVFVDETDQYRKSWETEQLTLYRMPSGELLCRYSPQFQIPGTLGMGSATHQPPPDAVEIQIAAKALYPAFPDWCKAYHGAWPHIRVHPQGLPAGYRPQSPSSTASLRKAVPGGKARPQRSSASS